MSVDAARELVGWANNYHIHLYNNCNLYTSFAITTEYTHSFDGQRIARNLFGSDLVSVAGSNRPVIKISGSQVANRAATDWLADYFGLPTDFQSTFSTHPTVDNLVVDFNYYLALNDWWRGLYFRMHAPVVHTRWDLNYCENITNLGTLGYNPGYFNDELLGTPRDNLLQSFEDYISGQRAPILEGSVSFEALQKAKMSPKRLVKTCLAELEVVLGWDIWQAALYHFGINCRAAFPSGNRPQGEYLFEPIVGNGHAWVIGAGISTHYQFWTDECTRTAGVYIDANFTHLFSARQGRIFDIDSGGNSRYMLGAKVDVPVSNSLQGPGGNLATGQFQNLLRPLANLTTFNVDVTIGMQTDIVILLDCTLGGLSMDLAYNFWSHNCERITVRNNCPPQFTNDTVFALKGDAYLFAFDVANANEPVALSSTERLATIHAGTNTPIGTTFTPAQTLNPNIDNPQLAFGDTGLGVQTLYANSLGINQQRTSIQPIVLNPNQLNTQGARTKGLSNRVIAHISYTWNEHCTWIPFIGCGGFAEFVPNFDILCSRDCTCIRTNINQWGVWLKGGASFN